ncbi:homeodomain-interacting protein kinase 1-like [Thalassophryne amazonica]|uniref:homeodomain-interacting protein kinase 1-like n=1 Tax=Thalassophryne amazonica TaxID=390379 RepID=UPI00147162E5|nr:homeodomain-interacting protein kinase 1-like [Thalassophryne amazonica]
MKVKVLSWKPDGYVRETTLDIQRDDFPVREGDVLQCFYVVQKFLGESSYGKVARCRHKVTYQDVAIKISKNKPSMIRETKKELANLKLLSVLDPEKANIVRWYDAFTHRDFICLKFELLLHSLHDYMDEMNFEPLRVSDLRAVVQQMATALLHLQTLGVIHCDIKPQNIMVVDHNQPLKVKLIDFGLAQHISEPPSFAGTLWYQAPEVHLGLAYSEEIDMWSLGVSVAELAMGTTPYPGHHSYDVMKFMVDTQGLPPEHLLRLGPYTNHCFERRRINGH